MSELKQEPPKIILSLKQANALLRVINSEYNDAPYMLDNPVVDNAIKYLRDKVASIEADMQEKHKKEYERKNKKCWYCAEKGTIRNGICNNCYMRN
jgi:hypothetical protein